MRFELRRVGEAPAGLAVGQEQTRANLLRLEIPEAYGGLGLDKVSAAYVGEQLAVNPSFGGSLGTTMSAA